ncbi:MAG: flagellar filament capping protein FliD [Gammaproteobacteria bacterium]|nr:flagellar filament capping protein FliD [Gammaproteobacteria bacterium]
MAQISSAGLGSGLDINSLVSQLVAAEAEPASLRLGRREAGLQARLSAYGSLKGALSAFQSSLSGLAGLATEPPRTARSSDTDIIAASAGSSAAEGSYSIEVSQLAQKHAVATGAYASESDVVGTGTITISFGEAKGTGFELNGERASSTITIDSGSNTLAGIRDAINEANTGVKASIINDGSGFRLVMTSDHSGARNSLKISISDTDTFNTDTSGLSAIAYDPDAAAGSGKNLVETQAALDAQLKINGLSITSETNTLNNTITGLALTLKDKTGASPETVTVSGNTGQLKTEVDKFVEGYNALMSALDELTAYNPDSRESGILIGDSTIRGVRSRIRNLVSNTIAGASGNYASLYSVGIKSDNNGKLSVDSSKLQSALDTDYANVARLFAASGVASDDNIEIVDAGKVREPGTYNVSVSTLATRASYIAAANGSLTVSSPANTFVIKVDGKTSGTITLEAMTYASGDALAAAIQSKINGDSTLASSGTGVSVSYNTDHLEIVSSKYGSESKLEIVSNTTSGLGLGVSSGTDGVDVAGALGNYPATGSGQQLSGSGVADGVRVRVGGDTTGDRGTVTYALGLAAQLDSVIDDFVDGDGLISSRTEGISESLKDIEKQRETLSQRLEVLERRYMAQFSALDLLVSQLRSTSDFIAQQLASLPGAKQRS